MGIISTQPDPIFQLTNKTPAFWHMVERGVVGYKKKIAQVLKMHR
jgi:hypothetical protein